MPTAPVRLRTRSAAFTCLALLLSCPPLAAETVPLKETKLIIEHNATDRDTGFQAFVDSEGWQRLELIGPQGVVLRFEGKGELGELGLTELFFETVEPENAAKPIAELLEDLPAGTYTFKGRAMADGEAGGEILGTAQLSHEIPAGPPLLAPPANATVPVAEVVLRWGAVTQTIAGRPIEIVAYQLIVERKTDPHPTMIGKWGLSAYLPPTTTALALPAGLLAPGTDYEWEVLAIAANGNQTLCSSRFRTQ